MTTPTRLPKRLDELNALFELRPIRSERDLNRATGVADRLALLNERNRAQEDYLHVLSLLIEEYEDAHHRIDTYDLDPIEVLKSLMDAREMSASDLGRLLGSRSLGSAILRGQRQLSKANITTLCRHFAVKPDLFIRIGRDERLAKSA